MRRERWRGCPELSLWELLNEEEKVVDSPESLPWSLSPISGLRKMWGKRVEWRRTSKLLKETHLKQSELKTRNILLKGVF